MGALTGSCVVYEPLDRYVDRYVSRDVDRHISITLASGKQLMTMYCVIGEFPVSACSQKLAKRLTGELRSYIQPMIAHDKRLDS